MAPRKPAAKKAPARKRVAKKASDNKPKADPPRNDTLADAEDRAPDGVHGKPRLAGSRKVSEKVESSNATADDIERLANRSVPADSKRKDRNVKVELRDLNDQTVHDVTRLAVLLGGEVKSRSGKHLVVVAPRGSDRDPDAAYNKLIAGLDADPLVVEVTA